jgi:hypothetical protein
MKLNGEVAGAYAAFHEAVSRATVEAYEKGPMAPLSGVPDDVARAISKAISLARPKARYTVSLSATVLLGQRAMLPDGAWDWVMRQTFPSPGA